MGDSKQQAVSAINSIPFGNIIGGPLSAAVYAQGDAAQTTINYLQSAMMQQSDFEAGASEPVTVTFSFFKDGTRMQMAVPLLTLVPLPYMHIDDLNISFTADITGCENGKIEARYSSASRSEEVATETETTMQALIDVSVHASTQHMPPGMAKLLQVFGDQLVKVEDVSVEELEEKWAEKERKERQIFKREYTLHADNFNVALDLLFQKLRDLYEIKNCNIKDKTRMLECKSCAGNPVQGFFAAEYAVAYSCNIYKRGKYRRNKHYDFIVWLIPFQDLEYAELIQHSRYFRVALMGESFQRPARFFGDCEFEAPAKEVEDKPSEVQPVEPVLDALLPEESEAEQEWCTLRIVKMKSKSKATSILFDMYALTLKEARCYVDKGIVEGIEKQVALEVMKALQDAGTDTRLEKGNKPETCISTLVLEKQPDSAVQRQKAVESIMTTLHTSEEQALKYLELGAVYELHRETVRALNMELRKLGFSTKVLTCEKRYYLVLELLCGLINHKGASL